MKHAAARGFSQQRARTVGKIELGNFPQPCLHVCELKVGVTSLGHPRGSAQEEERSLAARICPAAEPFRNAETPHSRAYVKLATAFSKTQR